MSGEMQLVTDAKTLLDVGREIVSIFVWFGREDTRKVALKMARSKLRGIEGFLELVENKLKEANEARRRTMEERMDESKSLLIQFVNELTALKQQYEKQETVLVEQMKEAKQVMSDTKDCWGAFNVIANSAMEKQARSDLRETANNIEKKCQEIDGVCRDIRNIVGV